MIATLPIVWKDMKQSISVQNMYYCIFYMQSPSNANLSILLLLNKKNESSYYLYISNSQKLAEEDEQGWGEIIVLIWQNFQYGWKQ